MVKRLTDFILRQSQFQGEFEYPLAGNGAAFMKKMTA